MNEAIKNRIEQVRLGQVPEGYKSFRCSVVPTEWKQYCLEQLITNEAQYTDDTDKYPLFSLTIEVGIVSKSDRYERSHLVLKQDAYKIVRKGGFVINPMNLHLGAISRYDRDEETFLFLVITMFFILTGRLRPQITCSICCEVRLCYSITRQWQPAH